jgi:hypothetical protein
MVNKSVNDNKFNLFKIKLNYFNADIIKASDAVSLNNKKNSNNPNVY